MGDQSLSSRFRDQLDEQKSNFLATISHELRTPMQSVYGLMELIQQQNHDPVIADMIRAAQGSAGLMLDLLDDILDFARLDADRLELEVLEVPIRTLVQGVVEALQVKITDRPVVLRGDIADDVPVIILGDPKRLRQILFNLVANALKFTERGSVTIEVRATPAVEADALPLLSFNIVDTGIGIAPEVQEKLFTPFTQADNSTARKFGGTGLGLSICRKLVALMGGEIGLRSEIGTGSTFWFNMPLHPIDQSSEQDLPDLSGLSILVLEDHPQGIVEMERLIKQMGGDVTSVPDLRQARQVLRLKRFDVAIIDYALPDGYGTDLIREAVTAYPRMGTILYTVHEHEGLVQTLSSLGATYLSKPASRRGVGEHVLDVAHRQWTHGTEVVQRVLVAEDTESVRQVLALQFKKLGVACDMVSNGVEALELMQQGGPYGLLLADLHMPVMDGYRLIHRVRATEDTAKRMPVILLTADVQMAQRSNYMRYGFDDCLIKPITFNHLSHALERWGIRVTVPEVTPARAALAPALPPSSSMVVDLVRLAEQMGAGVDGARNLLKHFPDMCAPLLEQINASVTARDLRGVAEAAHSLKGAARSACCDMLGNVAATLQELAEQEMPIDHLIAPINAAFEDVRRAIADL